MTEPIDRLTTALGNSYRFERDAWWARDSKTPVVQLVSDRQHIVAVSLKEFLAKVKQ